MFITSAGPIVPFFGWNGQVAVGGVLIIFGLLVLLRSRVEQHVVD